MLWTREMELAAIEAFIARGRLKVLALGETSGSDEVCERKMSNARKSAWKKQRKSTVVQAANRRKHVSVGL